MAGWYENSGGRYKRMRLRCKGKSDLDYYEYKLEQLKELERLSQAKSIELFYGDESHVCTQGYVPYGW